MTTPRPQPNLLPRHKRRPRQPERPQWATLSGAARFGTTAAACCRHRARRAIRWTAAKRSAPPGAPTWQGISGRAGDRVPGLSAEEYLRESILDPAAYIVEGYLADSMAKGYRFLLSEEDIDGLVAFLLTQ